MHPETVRMYLNGIKSIFFKENYEKFIKMYKEGEIGEEAEVWLSVYHTLNRDVKKTNQFFNSFIRREEVFEIFELIDKEIDHLFQMKGILPIVRKIEKRW